MELIQTVVLPLAPLAAQLGVHIDVPALVESMGDKMDLPDLWKWFKSKAPVLNPVGVGGGSGPGSPADPGGSPGGRVSAAPTNAAAQGPPQSSPQPSAKSVGEPVGV